MYRMICFFTLARYYLLLSSHDKTETIHYTKHDYKINVNDETLWKPTFI